MIIKLFYIDILESVYDESYVTSSLYEEFFVFFDKLCYLLDYVCRNEHVCHQMNNMLIVNTV